MLRRALPLVVGFVAFGCGAGTEPEPVEAVSIAGPSNVLVGQTIQLTALALSATGATLPGRKATWTSQNPSIASVSANGTVTGVVEGSARIEATIGGKTGFSVIQVGYPYPNVSGSFAYAAVIDGLPSSTASGVGVVAIAQGDRTKPDIQMSPIVSWVIGTSSYNFAGAHAATISTTGAISFRMGPASTTSTTTWQHTGTRTASGGFTGRHTLADATTSISGNWAMVRTSGAQAMLLNRGVAILGTVDDVRRALSAFIAQPYRVAAPA